MFRNPPTKGYDQELGWGWNSVVYINKEDNSVETLVTGTPEGVDVSKDILIDTRLIMGRISNNPKIIEARKHLPNLHRVRIDKYEFSEWEIANNQKQSKEYQIKRIKEVSNWVQLIYRAPLYITEKNMNDRQLARLHEMVILLRDMGFKGKIGGKPPYLEDLVEEGVPESLGIALLNVFSETTVYQDLYDTTLTEKPEDAYYGFWDINPSNLAFDSFGNFILLDPLMLLVPMQPIIERWERDGLQVP